MRIKQTLKYACGVLALIGLCSLSHAADLEKPTGDVLLEIIGEVENSNGVTLIDDRDHRVAAFDIAMLEALPAETIITKTPWTTGETEFTGVRMSVLMEYVGADDSNISLTALDEYTVDVVDPEFDEYPILLAYKVNGDYMSVRELGPLWVMYPFDDYPVLVTSTNNARCVWQLTRILVR